MALNGIYLFLLGILTFVNAIGPDRFWLGSVNLYLPQWLWGLPGAALLFLTLLLSPRRVWIPLAGLLWVAGPIMGFCWNTARAATGKGIHLRVMTYNVKWGIHDAEAIANDVVRFHPDLLQLQDSAGVLNGPLGKVLSGWNVRVSGQYIVASRLPLSDLISREIAIPGEHHHCVESILTAQGVDITLFDVHLLSPRGGLEAVRYRRQVDDMEENAEARNTQAHALVSYIRQQRGPLVMTGDLNAPVQSLICKELFAAGLRDAFSEAGRGYGYTYGQYTRVRMPYVRIDHILVNTSWLIENCQVGNARGSEHSPVIADLFLPTKP